MTTVRCFDDNCNARRDCRLYLNRMGPPYGPVAMTWRQGWETQNGPCFRLFLAMGLTREDLQLENSHA